RGARGRLLVRAPGGTARRAARQVRGSGSGLPEAGDHHRRRFLRRAVPGMEGMAALVTGGGSGIGFGCARRFATDGAHVTIAGRTEARLAAAVDEIAAAAPGTNVRYAV